MPEFISPRYLSGGSEPIEGITDEAAAAILYVDEEMRPLGYGFPARLMLVHYQYGESKLLHFHEWSEFLILQAGTETLAEALTLFIGAVKTLPQRIIPSSEADVYGWLLVSEMLAVFLPIDAPQSRIDTIQRAHRQGRLREFLNDPDARRGRAYVLTLPGQICSYLYREQDDHETWLAGPEVDGEVSDLMRELMQLTSIG